MITAEFLDAVALSASRSPEARTIPWPTPENLGGFMSFTTYAEWQRFFMSFRLKPGVPLVVAESFDRAIKLYVLGWLDFDLVIAGETMALCTLEHTVRDRYLGKERERRRGHVVAKALVDGREPTKKEKAWIERITFSDLLKFMVEQDGLTDECVGLIRRTGGSVKGLLMGTRDPNLADIRNVRAHGNPFGSGFESGLLELIRDLIEYAYRDMIQARAA